jgi:hypothetical protein
VVSGDDEVFEAAQEKMTEAPARNSVGVEAGVGAGVAGELFSGFNAAKSSQAAPAPTPIALHP